MPFVWFICDPKSPPRANPMKSLQKRAQLAFHRRLKCLKGDWENGCSGGCRNSSGVRRNISGVSGRRLLHEGMTLGNGRRRWRRRRKFGSWSKRPREQIELSQTARISWPPKARKGAIFPGALGKKRICEMPEGKLASAYSDRVVLS